jgi:hypothetical protein
MMSDELKFSRAGKGRYVSHCRRVILQKVEGSPIVNGKTVWCATVDGERILPVGLRWIAVAAAKLVLARNDDSLSAL